MQEWEYKMVKSSKFDETEINMLGDEGWELVAVTENPAYYSFFFKRPKQ